MVSYLCFVAVMSGHNFELGALQVQVTDGLDQHLRAARSLALVVVWNRAQIIDAAASHVQ